MSFFNIPGNIHQASKIFVQDKENALNKFFETSRELGSAKPQKFTYKNDTDIQNKHGKLNFYPSSLEDIMIQDDVAYKLLYGKGKQSKESSITINDILDNIPGVQIREFLPDTRLDQCINLFCDMFSSMTKLFSKDDTDKTTKDKSKQSAQETKQQEEAAWYEKIFAATKFTMKYMVGAYPGGNPSFLGDVGNAFAGETFPVACKMPSDFKSRILAFPYALYYNLQSCVTNNVYYIPAVTDPKMVLQSGDGHAGWTSGGDMLSDGGIRLSGLLGKIPLIGSLANMILGNIGINYMPWWNADAGTKVKEPEVSIKFDLFNDSADAAMSNFLFVNTIVPSNKFIQYGMFQHSSSIYDVKIEGINRLFACAGDFKVSYEGVLREPPDSWLDVLANKHHNPNVTTEDELKSVLKDNKLIKIPDVYRVEMRFQSLLPASFNNYVFNYVCNEDVIKKASSVYHASGAAEALPLGMSKYLARVKKVYDAGNDEAETAKSTNDAAQEVQKKHEDRKAEEAKKAKAAEEANKAAIKKEQADTMETFKKEQEQQLEDTKNELQRQQGIGQ